MTLKDIELKEEYDTIAGDDLNRDFFNKVLSESNVCYRVGGLFSSRNFAMCAEGMQKFIENDGQMQLVLTSVFSPEDAKAINDGIKNPDEVLSENWIKSFNDIKEKFVEDHTKALAWMLAGNILKIRIVIPYDNFGKVLDSSRINQLSIFQRKTGIYADSEGNSISFYGNIDFDHKTYGEYYHLRVFRNWGDESEKKFTKKDWDEFIGFWNGTKFDQESEFKIKIIPLPEAIEKKLIEIKPRSKSDIRLQKPPILRQYQKNAIQKWVDNDRCGILQMATGTGKTFTAIGCIENTLKSQTPLLVIIVCPYVHLIHQWAEELKKWGMNSSTTQGNPGWYQKIKDSIASLQHGKNHQILITSYDIFANERFYNLMESCSIPLMLIADEAHHAGALEAQRGLIGNYKYRLALTATFKRYFDDEGTDKLEKYFGGTVYEKSLKEAIDEGFLVKYCYHLIFVDLRADEYEKYKKETRIIAQYWDSKTEEGQRKLRDARIRRSNIIANAENKITAFEELISDKSNLKYLLVYVTGKQLNTVKEKLLNAPNPTIPQEITDDVPKNKKDRTKILKALAEEKIGAIVAINVLDEGTDIPEAKECMILASSGNPKQFIQRRGRVLRTFSETYKDGTTKQYATIYDFVVIPAISDEYTEDEIKVERSIVKSQLDRLESMGGIAINSNDCLDQIQKIKIKYKIV